VDDTSGKEMSFRARLHQSGRRLLRHENAVVGLVLVIITAVVAVASRGATVTRANFDSICIQSSTRGIAAVGQLFVILTAGIDLSIGGIALVSAVLGGATMTTEVAHTLTGSTIAPIMAIPIMLLLGAGLGVANGSLVARASVPALIATLGMWQISRGGALLICQGEIKRSLPETLNFFGGGEVAGVPVPFIIFISLAAVAYFVLCHTSYGKSVYAAGANPLAAWLSGINVAKIRFSVYVISGFLAALAGLIMLSRVMCAGMNTAVGLELDSIAAVCIGGVSLMGGRGTLIGAVIGVFIMGVINNAVTVLGVEAALHDVLRGVIIVAAVGIDSWRRRS
jgi:putative xylitol transport system permease protein